MVKRNLKNQTNQPKQSKLSGREIYSVVDIDSFEAMVWAQEFPELNGKPVVVMNMQNVIIAVSYEAKKHKISRADSIRSAQLKLSTPPLKFFEIPGKDGKSDQKIPTTASFRIQKCVRDFVKENFPGILVSMKSKDEIYFELSKYVDNVLEQNSSLEIDFLPHKPKTVWIGGGKETLLEDRRLAFAANVTEEILQKIKQDTGFVASAGVADSCIVAKIACGNDKPDSLTIVTKTGKNDLYAQTDVQDAPYLKGKHGDSIVVMHQNDESLQPLKSLLDFKTYANINDIQIKLHLTDFSTNQLKEVATGEDLKHLEDVRKASFMSSWKVTHKDRPCTEETLKKYIGNCCEELELKIKYENILFERIPKKMKIELKSRVSKRSSDGEPNKISVTKLDTRSIEYPGQELKPEELGIFVWIKLCEIWQDSENSFSNFDQVAETFITAVY